MGSQHGTLFTCDDCGATRMREENYERLAPRGDVFPPEGWHMLVESPPPEEASTSRTAYFDSLACAGRWIASR